MNQGPTEQLVKATRRLPWRILLAVAVTAIFVFAGYYLMAQDSVVELMITDGSVTGTIQGDFLEISQDDAIWSDFNATTYAERTGRPASTLTLQISAMTYFGLALLSGNDAVITILYLTVVGAIDSELGARNLEIVYNQTANNTTALSVKRTLWGTNATYDHQTYFIVRENESGMLEVDLVNRTETNAIYEFSFGGNILVEANEDTNLADRFICIRAIVNGKLEPEFSVSVSILMVNTS
jgi:hypothetical protein